MQRITGMGCIIEVITEGTCIYNEGFNQYSFLADLDEIPETKEDVKVMIEKALNLRDEKVVTIEIYKAEEHNHGKRYSIAGYDF